MADGYRHPQQAVGNPFYSQYSSSTSIANEISLNSLLNYFVADPHSAPKPPASSSPSQNPRSMYGQNHQQGHNSRLNGAPAGQRMPLLYNYQQQPTHQHQAHPQHHQPLQPDHAAAAAAAAAHAASGNVMSHHSAFSSGVLSNASPFSNNLQNGAGHQPSARPSQPQQVNEHWGEQLRMRKEAERAHGAMTEQHQPHYYARLKAPDNRGISSSTPGGPASQADSDNDKRPLSLAVDKPIRRQDWHNLDMSGQGLRVLSPSLFSYTFLRELYIASNRLTSLPAEIGQLRQLHILEASYNQISELPPEIAMCSNLRQLLLFDNNIRDLPYEIGSLYYLEMLGIEGNPLNPTMKEEVVERGTKSLVSLLREQAPVPLPPSPRKAVVVQEDVSPNLERVKTLTWNILCNKYASERSYGFTPSGALSWDYRKELIMQEIREMDVDILCLQEIATDAFRDYFNPHLAAGGYRGIHWPRPKAKTMSEKEAQIVDGCAVFYKASKFILLDKQLIDYAAIAINRPDMKNHHDIFNRVMPKDNIGMICFFESRQTGARMIVANTHLAWEPHLADVKLVQTAILMESITTLADKYTQWPPCKDKKSVQPPPSVAASADDGQDQQKPEPPPEEPAPSQEYRSSTDIPLLVCGDYNSTENSGVYELLSKGRTSPDHPEFGTHQYGSFTRDGFEHPFSLRSAYLHLNGTSDELPFTNYVPDFSEVIDYIWYSTNTLEVVELLGPLDRQYLKRVPGFPNYHFPADHIQLMAEFVIKARKDKKILPEPDFGSGSHDRRG